MKFNRNKFGDFNFYAYLALNSNTMRTLLFLFLLIPFSLSAQIYDFVGAEKQQVLSDISKDAHYADGQWDGEVFYSKYEDLVFGLAFENETVAKQVIAYPYAMDSALINHLSASYTEIGSAFYADFSVSPIKFYRVHRDVSLILTIHF